MSASKLSNTGDGTLSLEDTYERLKRYIFWLASARATDHILMRADELVGELNEQLVYGWMYYSERGLSTKDMLSVIKRMLHNRVGELVYRFYGTHRNSEKDLLDLDALDMRQGTSGDAVEEAVRNSQCFDDFLHSLTQEEVEVVEAILYPDLRMQSQIILTCQRRSYVFQTCTITMNWKLVADALHIHYPEAKAIWKSIQTKWRRSYGQ